MKCIITGGAGFVGSNLCRALSKKNKVKIVDNFSTGSKKNLILNKNIKIVKCDLLDLKKLKREFKNYQIIFHLAANADVRFNLQNPRKVLEQNAICTSNVLEAMKFNNIRKIVFSSSGSVYGDSNIFPTPENAPISNQTSLYGASKLYCEGLIHSYCEGFNFQSWIFRFGSLLGPNYSHGHVFDFIKKLLKNDKKINVLGDGNQKKTYLHVYDCVNAMLQAINKSKKKINTFNLATNDYISVKESLNIICDKMDAKPKRVFEGDKGKGGWIGDQPFVFLSIKKIKKLGWKNKFTIRKGIEDTIEWILKNKWVLKRRK